MGKNTHTDIVLEQIQEKIKLAPHDWAQQIAILMKKSETSVYAYANGKRGLRRGCHVEVLKHLNKIVAEKNAKIEKIINQ